MLVAQEAMQAELDNLKGKSSSFTAGPVKEAAAAVKTEAEDSRPQHVAKDLPNDAAVDLECDKLLSKPLPTMAVRGQVSEWLARDLAEAGLEKVIVLFKQDVFKIDSRWQDTTSNDTSHPFL